MDDDVLITYKGMIDSFLSDDLNLETDKVKSE